MKFIGASQFKEQCLALLECLDQDGIVITKRGKPAARLVPIASSSSGLIGQFKNRVVAHGDILTTGFKWRAES